METLFLCPAYGRSYKSMTAALNDWHAGKDFQIYRGPYCSIRDITQLRKMFPDSIRFLLKETAAGPHEFVSTTWEHAS